jgi:hypothetical protein
MIASSASYRHSRTSAVDHHGRQERAIAEAVHGLQELAVGARLAQLDAETPLGVPANLLRVQRLQASARQIFTRGGLQVRRKSW